MQTSPTALYPATAARSLVVIPTYNERENIEAIVDAVLAVTPSHVHVLVADDSSPDGTGELVRAKMASEPERVHLLVGPRKQGLGRAYVAAFRWGLARGYEQFIEMDADFSHRPEDLVKILGAMSSGDFVVGSRYVEGGRTVNWGLGRKLISRGGSIYSRMILGYPLNDWTGGFNAWHRRVLEGIDIDSIRSEGYSFQIELKYRAERMGFRGVEVPIVFEDRRVGQSKMSSGIVFEAMSQVVALRFQSVVPLMKRES